MTARGTGQDAIRSPAASLFVVGFLSMLGQVVLLRELAVASFGVELIYLLALGLWLAAGAAGAALGGRGAAAPPRPAAVFLALAVSIPMEIAFLRGARLLFGGVTGAYLPLGEQVATAALGTVPAGVILGLLFRRAAGWMIADGGTLAAAYAWECLGGALGSVAATLSLHWGIPNLALGLGCGLVGAAAASTGSAVRRFIPLLAALLAVFLASGPLDRWMTSWNHADLSVTTDTPYGRVTVTRTGKQLVVFENDALGYESEGTEAEELVHLAALQAPVGSRVLALGGGVAGIAAEIRRHGPSGVDYVEANRRMYEALLPLLPEETRRALGNAPLRVIFADPRSFLSRSTTPYDLILVASPEPTSGQSNRLYTVEFFRQCAARLAPSGVVALRLPSAENFWTPQLLRRNGSVHSALLSVFPEVLVVPGSVDTLLASRARLERDPGVLGARLKARGISGRLVTPEYLRYLLTNDRVGQIAGLLSRADTTPNTDARPVCYQLTALLWLGKFIPGAGDAGPPDGRILPVLLALVAVALLIARFRVAWRRAALVAVAGFGGMVAEAVILLRFQAESGSLYQDIGILLTCFMFGLAAGAFALDRAATARPRVERWWGAALLLGLALFSCGLAAVAEAGGAFFRLGPSALALGIAGALVAGIFGFASRQGVDDRQSVVSRLYAADLLGGCLGSILAGLLLIPLFGVVATAAGMAVLAIAALALL